MSASNEPAPDPEERPDDDPPMLGFSERAERARLRVRRRMLAWWLLSAMIGWGYAAFLVFLAWREGRGFVVAGAASLGFWWLGRRTFRSVLDVWRTETYPGRYWEITGEGFGCLPIAIGLVGLLAWTALCIIFGILPAAEVDFIGLGCSALGFFLALLWISANVDCLVHYVRVQPYFRKRVGEIDTYYNGFHMARHLRDLDELAGSLGVVPLSIFGWNDDFRGEALVWHPSAEGLKTVNALLAHLQADEFTDGERAGIVDDLKRIAQALDRADRLGIDFCLLVDYGNVTSGAEHDVRKGSFF